MHSEFENNKFRVPSNSSNKLHTYNVERVFRIPILGDNVPESCIDDNVLQTIIDISINNTLGQ